jgi:hypothetical protein
MTGKYFRFSDVLGYGWYVMKTNFWFFVGVGIVLLIISYTPLIINTVLQRASLTGLDYRVLNALTNVVSWIINIILGIGLVKIALSFCDEQKPALGTLLNFWGCFWRYLGAGILFVLICVFGFILLIVPGMIWSVKFGLWPYFVIDKGLGPIAALKASARTTMGIKWDLFGLGIVCGLINFVGFLCLIVGVFATYPTVIVAHSLVYRQLAAQTPELAEWGITNALTAGDTDEKGS